MKRVIVRMPNWIGDFVMALPVLEDWKKAHPEDEITVLASYPLGELLEGNPFIDHLISFSRKRRFFPKTKEGESLIRALRKGRYDTGLLLTNSFSSVWLFWAGKVNNRIGFYRRARNFFLHKKVHPNQEAHLVEQYKELLGGRPSSSTPKLYPAPVAKEQRELLIGINPGAAYGSAKCWLPERFREVAERIVNDIPGCRVAFFGDLKTKPLIDEITKGASPLIQNKAGKTSLKELVSEIAKLDAFLTNDSGPMHIAAALEVPLVALFGSTNDKATGPYKWGEVIHKRVSCSPCYKRVCPIDFKCMKQISVEEVVQAIKRSLLIRMQEKRPSLFLGGLAPPLSSPKADPTKKMGCLILAAGAGRRLGFDKPKGCLEIRGKSLYEILLEKAKGPVAIMTSPFTHEETKRFLEERGYGEIPLIKTRAFPRTTRSYSESPEGNGAVFRAITTSPLWDAWKELDTISVIPIDNPLADGFDTRMGGSELVVKAVRKKSPDEKVGLLVEKEGKLHVKEYFELQEEDPSDIAYSGMFAMSPPFCERAAKLDLPWHLVEKIDGSHYEQFAFDAFSEAKNYTLFLIDREKEFAPIKTKGDVAFVEDLLYNRSHIF